MTRRVAFSVFVAGCAGRSGDGGGSNDDVTGNCILSIQRLGLAMKTQDRLFLHRKPPDAKSGRFFVFASFPDNVFGLTTTFCIGSGDRRLDGVVLLPVKRARQALLGCE